MRVTLALILLSLVAAPTGAIVIRHGREDAKYRTLGHDTPAVVRLADGGMGTLIAPQWILAAAHVAEDLDLGVSVSVDGVLRHVSAISPPPESSLQKGADIAVVRLDAAIDRAMTYATHSTHSTHPRHLRHHA